MHVRVRSSGELVRTPTRHDGACGGRYAGPKHRPQSFERRLRDCFVIALFEFHSCGARGEGEKHLLGRRGRRGERVHAVGGSVGEGPRRGRIVQEHPRRDAG